MTEIRWHGRGGQGAFTAAKLLGAAAALYEGRQSMAFPSFGPERRGAPVLAFTKIDRGIIRDRTEIKRCDVIVLLDDTLYSPSYINDLKENGILLVNSPAAGAGPGLGAHLEAAPEAEPAPGNESGGGRESGRRRKDGACPENAFSGSRRMFHADALSVAQPILGRPITNTAMLGALAGLTGLVSLEALLSAADGFFTGGLLEKNRSVLKAAYKLGREAGI